MPFQDLSRNLGVLGGKRQSPYYSQPAQDDTVPKSVDFRKLSESLNLFKSAALEAEAATSTASSSSSGYEKVGPGEAKRAKEPGAEEEEEEGADKFYLTPPANYNKLSENLSVFKKRVEDEDDPAEAMIHGGNIDYNRLSDNLSILNKESNDADDTTEKQDDRAKRKKDNEKYDNLSKNFADAFNKSGDIVSKSVATEEEEAFCYQNITCETMGYTDASVDVRPYAVSRFNFVAEFANELGFSAGEMIYLTRYVDKEWLEGEIDGQKGMFPISYVSVIVDCKEQEVFGPASHASNGDHSGGGGGVFRSTAVTVHENLVPDTYHKVLYNFHAQMDGDITVAEGEVVLIVEKTNDDWVKVENSQGETGSMPGNHLSPTPEFEGKATFDIERLLSYRSKKQEKAEKTKVVETATVHKPVNQANTTPRPDLKLFDPLCSPGESKKIEEELKANKQPKVTPILDKSANAPPRRSGVHASKMQPKPPRDIESLINSNLSKLRSTSPSRTTAFDTAATARNKHKVNMSQMVLEEMRGKNPPKRPSEPPKFAQAQLTLDILAMKAGMMTDNGDEIVNGSNGTTTASETVTSNNTTSTPPPPTSASPAPSLPTKPGTKSPAPPKPPPPKFRQNKPPAPKPPPPLPPPPKDIEPIYSQINKYVKRSYSVAASDTVQSKRLAPARPPPIRQSSIPASASRPHHEGSPVHSYDTPETSSPMSTSTPDLAGEKCERTPTNENVSFDDLNLNQISSDECGSNKSDPIYSGLESVYAPPSSVISAAAPSVPARTSSIAAPPISRKDVEAFRSYMNLKEYTCPTATGPVGPFPPDRESPPASEDDIHPPKVATLPCRSISVASSIKSRSAFYATV